MSHGSGLAPLLGMPRLCCWSGFAVFCSFVPRPLPALAESGLGTLLCNMRHKGEGAINCTLYPCHQAALSFCCEGPGGETMCYAVFCTLKDY